MKTTVIAYIAKGNSLRNEARNFDTKTKNFTIKPQINNLYTYCTSV